MVLLINHQAYSKSLLSLLSTAFLIALCSSLKTLSKWQIIDAPIPRTKMAAIESLVIQALTAGGCFTPYFFPYNQSRVNPSQICAFSTSNLNDYSYPPKSLGAFGATGVLFEEKASLANLALLIIMYCFYVKFVTNNQYRKTNQYQIAIISGLAMQKTYQSCHAHQGQLLQIVCMDCESKCLVCPLCIDADHEGHAMMSLKKFIGQEIPKLYQTKPSSEVVSQTLNKVAGQYKSTFEKMRKKIGNALNELQIYYDQESQKLLEQLMVVCGQGEHLYTVQKITAIKMKIKNKQKIDQQPILIKRAIQMREKFKLSMEQAAIEVIKLLESLKYLWESSEGFLLNSREVSKFTFSTIKKHQNIDIDKIFTRAVNKVYDNTYHVALVQPALTPFHNKVSFRINQSDNKCIWIGVCHAPRVKQLKYTNCFSMGQGAYWIWQAGCQQGAQYFSHTPSENPVLEWNFDVGDIITVSIEFPEKQEQKHKKAKLIFQKDQQTKFSAIVDINSSGLFYPCVGLGDQNQSVSIVSKKI